MVLTATKLHAIESCEARRWKVNTMHSKCTRKKVLYIALLMYFLDYISVQWCSTTKACRDSVLLKLSVFEVIVYYAYNAACL